jgi:hypothetical protein
MSAVVMMWRGRDVSKYGDLADALMGLASEDEAREFWHAYVVYLNRPDATLLGRTAEDVAAANIGYLMGYCGTAERQRVYGLFAAFNVEHPIFGRMSHEASS